MPTPAFRPLFERWASRVRARLALRHVLTGAAVGLLLGAGASAALWKTRHGALRPTGAAGGLLGAAVGLAVSRRRRWADGDVALYLDARLAADEAIATAVELDRTPDDGDDPARAVVVSQATGALAAATPARVRAPVFHAWHAAIPVAAAAIGWASLAPLPPPPAGPAAPPGAEKVQLAQLEGLEKVIKLAEMNARDDAQRERLKKLAEEAKKLREKLREGVEKREAQADIARMRDGITAEKLTLGDGEQRQGMESALGKLGENPDLKQAQKALGDRDLVSLDDEMERLANKLEKGDRQRAQQTLEEAAEAAKRNGAPGVAKALEEEKKRLAEHGKKNDKLRELAKELGDALGAEGKEALRDLDKGGGKQQAKLADKLESALGKLTPEQRKQLAENLRKKMASAPEDELGPSPSKRQLKEMLDQLDTPEGQKQLEDELKKMAEAPPEGSEEGDRQKGLGEAEDGAGEAEKQLGGGMPMPLPMEGAGAGKSGPGKTGPGDKGDPTAGHSEGGGAADHKGMTGVIEGGDMKARASGRLNKGRPMPGVVMGRSAGRVGDTANVQGTGALGTAAPAEIGGVDRSDVPEEYREQVGRYFQPK
jgi:hypothetical protein